MLWLLKTISSDPNQERAKGPRVQQMLFWTVAPGRTSEPVPAQGPRTAGRNAKKHGEQPRVAACGAAQPGKLSLCPPEPEPGSASDARTSSSFRHSLTTQNPTAELLGPPPTTAAPLQNDLPLAGSPSSELQVLHLPQNGQSEQEPLFSEPQIFRETLHDFFSIYTTNIVIY